MSEPDTSPPNPDSGDDNPIVLGREYAAALAAEQRHQHSRDGEPLLAGVGYDFWAGELDLHRLVEAPADEPVQALVEAFLAGDDAARSRIRASLDMDGLYNLLTYSRRSSLQALRAESVRAAIRAVNALALIDSERVDWRDTTVAAGLASHILAKLVPDPGPILTAAQGLAEPTTARIMSRFANSAPETDLADWGYMQVDTNSGPGLILCGIAPFAPTINLVELAFRIGELVDDNMYRLGSISAAEELHAVWLPGASPSDTEPVLARCRATMSIGARLRPTTHPTSDSQQLTIFVVEARAESDAVCLHEWSVTGPDSAHTSVAWQRGPIFTLLVARSFVVGVEPFETQASLERFRKPIEEIIAAV